VLLGVGGTRTGWTDLGANERVGNFRAPRCHTAHRQQHSGLARLPRRPAPPLVAGDSPNSGSRPMTIITYRDIVPLRGSMNPDERRAVEAEFAATNQRLADLAAEGAHVMARRRDVIDTALSIRDRLWPHAWYHGRRRPEPDAPALPPIAPGAIYVHGRALRQLCRDVLRRQGPQTLIELHSSIHLLGYAIHASWPAKALADAMRYEVGIGAAERIKRGVYRAVQPGNPPLPPHPTGENNLHTQGGPPFVRTVADLTDERGQRRDEAVDDRIHRSGNHPDPIGQMRNNRRPLVCGQLEQRRQSGGIERHVHRALKPCARSRPTLTEAHHFATADQHLTGPDACEAHEARPQRGNHRARVHHGVRADDRRPTRPKPRERSADVVAGHQRVSARRSMPSRRAPPALLPRRSADGTRRHPRDAPPRHQQRPAIARNPMRSR
jgi:hypothetical protein